MDDRDEFFHLPGDDEYWSESHYLDAVGEDVQVEARLGWYPNRNVANVFAYVLTDEATYAIRDEAIDPAAVHGTTVDAPALRFELEPVTVGREWRVRIDGAARRCDSPGAVLAGDGERVHLDCEFVARARHEPFLYSEGAVWPGGPDEDRYEVATRVEGEVTIGGGGTGESEATGRTLTIEGPGERDHSWGTRDWTAAEWLWISGGFDDGAAYNHLSAWLPGDAPPAAEPVVTNGFWFDGETVHPITDAAVSADPTFSARTATAWAEDGEAPAIDLSLAWAAGSATVAVEPLATTPVDWEDPDSGGRALLNRSPARQTRDDDVAGRGFLENMTQTPLE